MEKYDYYRQDDGRYTVIGVPIFATTNKGDDRDVSLEDLHSIVRNMENEKQSRGWYARVIGRHQSEEDYSNNAPGVGYVDNYRVKETGDNEGILYADYVDIDSDMFDFDEKKKIVNIEKFPGRSVEYRPMEHLIESVALLESRTPYFRFPIFQLGQEVSSLTEYQKELAVIRFQAISNTNSRTAGINPSVADTMRKEEKNVAKNQMKRLRRKASMLSKENAHLREQLEELKKYQDEDEETEDYMDHNKEKMSDHDEDKKEEYMDEEVIEEAAEEKKEEYGGMKEMFMKCMQEHLPEMMNQYMKEHGMEFMKKYMDSMAGIEEPVGDDIPNQLDPLAMQADTMNKKYAQDVAKAAEKIANNYDFEKKNSFVTKYQSEEKEIYQVAKDAAQDWEDTVNQRDKTAARKFQKQWGSKEKFVDSAVAQEKARPGSYYKIMF